MSVDEVIIKFRALSAVWDSHDANLKDELVCHIAFQRSYDLV